MHKFPFFNNLMTHSLWLIGALSGVRIVVVASFTAARHHLASLAFCLHACASPQLAAWGACNSERSIVLPLYDTTRTAASQ